MQQVNIKWSILVYSFSFGFYIIFSVSKINRSIIWYALSSKVFLHNTQSSNMRSLYNINVCASEFSHWCLIGLSDLINNFVRWFKFDNLSRLISINYEAGQRWQNRCWHSQQAFSSILRFIDKHNCRFLYAL